MDTTEVRHMAYRAIKDLAQTERPLSYDNIIELTAYSLGIEMNEKDEFSAELYRKFDRVWDELNK